MSQEKRLTEMQMKFAYELVTNEGRKTKTECCIDAGYSKDAATVMASKLTNPKVFPLVVKYIGELREEYQKKYEVTFENHISELAKLRDESRKKVRGLRPSTLKWLEVRQRVFTSNKKSSGQESSKTYQRKN
jgi:phage terminase small subunit